MNTSNINPNEASSDSQWKEILDYMEQGNVIDGMKALNMFGCFRLPSRINDIKKKGYDVKDRWKQAASGKRVKEYYLEGIQGKLFS